MTEQAGTGWVDAWAGRIERWPRMVRVVLSFVFTLVVTVLAFLLLEMLIFDSASGENTTLSMIVMAVIGIVLYVGSWWALVGFDDDLRQEWRAGAPAVYAVLITVIGTIALVGLIVALIVSAT